MQLMQRNQRSANICKWSFGVLVFAMLSACVSYPMPEDEDEDSRMTIIACFFASCDNEITEGKGKSNAVD